MMIEIAIMNHFTNQLKDLETDNVVVWFLISNEAGTSLTLCKQPASTDEQAAVC